MYRGRPATPHEQFLDQFEEAGGGWLYRHRMTGPAYRVTDAEKDAFVAAADQRRRRFAWIAAAIWLLVLVAVFIPPLFDTPLSRFYPERPPSYAVWLGFLLPVSSQWINDFVMLGGPLKTLRLRAPIAPALSRAERRRLTLERLQLTVLVGTATVSFLLLLYFALERPAVGLMSLALIAASIVALVWAIVQGTRKWLLNRADHAANIFT